MISLIIILLWQAVRDTFKCAIVILTPIENLIRLIMPKPTPNGRVIRILINNHSIDFYGNSIVATTSVISVAVNFSNVFVNRPSKQRFKQHFDSAGNVPRVTKVRAHWTFNQRHLMLLQTAASCGASPRDSLSTRGLRVDG